MQNVAIGCGWFGQTCLNNPPYDSVSGGSLFVQVTEVVLWLLTRSGYATTFLNDAVLNPSDQLIPSCPFIHVVFLDKLSSCKPTLTFGD